MLKLNNKKYFYWLCGKIDCREYSEYEKLLELLYSEFFYSLIPNDDNRGLDGLNLRGLFEIETNELLDEEDMHYPCTLLEMLIALSERMAFVVFDPGKDDEPNSVSCFWQLLSNLKLKPSSNRNVERIYIFLEREYTSSGKGGLFPLKSAKKDQRNVEIWYQMMAYIEERLL